MIDILSRHHVTKSRNRHHKVTSFFSGDIVTHVVIFLMYATSIHLETYVDIQKPESRNIYTCIMYREATVENTDKPNLNNREK